MQPMLDELKHVGRSDYTLLLKELIAGLGSISSDSKIAIQISNAAGAEMIIEIAINNTHSTKLVKSCIGALVNLSLQQPTVERIASNFRFYELTRHVLTSNTQSSYVLEYMLRLLVNCLVSSNCQYHLADRVVVSQLYKCLEMWSGEEDLCIYALFILRSLGSSRKIYTGLDIIADTLDPASFIKSILNVMRAQLGSVKVLTEAIFCMSVLTQDGNFLEEIKNNAGVGEVLKSAINKYQTDQMTTLLLTESIANLPIEDLSLIV